MNERIRELLKKAEERYPRHLAVAVPEVILRQDALEKFADLIVKECIGCCEQAISDPVPESVDTWLNGGEQCIQEIKQHFGVEE